MVLYDQSVGVAMGSPLAPLLANLFMGHHEKLWLENFQGSEILFYRRYVVDMTGTPSYARLMTSRASQEYSAPGSCWKTKIYLYLFCIYINNNNI